MKCGSCSNEGKVFVEYTNIYFCRSCYEKMLFRRLKKWFRINSVIHEGMVHVVVDDGSVAAEFLIKFFKKFFSYPGLKWVTRKRLTSKMAGKIIILPDTLTFETDRFMHAALNNEDYHSDIASGNVFKPMTIFLDSDLLKWRRSKKKAQKFGDEHGLIDEIVKRRPMARFSILNQLEEF